MRAEAPRTSSFDEAWYLRHNPDIAGAVAAGLYGSGYAHWIHSGRAENRVPPPGFGGEEAFGEAAYLLANPDVASAVAAGVYSSGQAHYEQVGQAEGRPLRPGAASGTSASTAAASALFDETWYLDQNRDVSRAIAAGIFPSAYQHWVTSGRQEGRSVPPGFDENALFDEPFYLLSYPEAAGEIADGRALNAQDHFATIGQFRGYLANGFAPRPVPKPGSAGFWTDAGDAVDQVDGRQAIGQVDAEAADLLRHWVHHGYVILPHALPSRLIDSAAAVLQNAFAGGLTGARFDCPAISPYGPVPWSPDLGSRPARAMDVHWLSAELRELVFMDPIRRFLELVFGTTVLASLSQGDLHGFPQDYRRDTAEAPFSLPLRAAACCIALEDAESGLVTYFPGSHKLPAPLFAKVQHSMAEARRVLPRAALRDADRDQHEALLLQLREAALPAQEFRARKGEVLIWNPSLVHGGMAAGASVTIHCCPRGIVPLGFEGVGGVLRWHGTAGQYSSVIYQE